jgi:hypothetical protein
VDRARKVRKHRLSADGLNSSAAKLR